MAVSVTLLSVNVAMPAVMRALHRGAPVRSGIDKKPTTASTLTLDWTNLAGDGQADLSVHGGPDKAVYAYPGDHFPAWEAEIGRPFGPGAFGENLTTLGVTEAEVCIGDRWLWGDAEMEVCQPRSPCFKLTLHAGTSEVGRRMRLDGRCGWYLRVLRPGEVPTTGTIEVVPHPAQVSVHDVTGAGRSSDPAAIARVLSVAALADEWRDPLTEALSGAGGVSGAGGRTP